MHTYTKTGDKKTTALIGNVRREKSDQRVVCYGACDEALASLGLAYNYIESEEIKQELKEIMMTFFYLNQDLANPEQAIPFAITNDHVEKIEKAIDRMEAIIEPLRKFIYPIACLSASYMNVTRTITRRAERQIVLLSTMEEINPFILPLINRLSDYFFVLGRYLNHLENFEDIEVIF